MGLTPTNLLDKSRQIVDVQQGSCLKGYLACQLFSDVLKIVGGKGDEPVLR